MDDHKSWIFPAGVFSSLELLGAKIPSLNRFLHGLRGGTVQESIQMLIRPGRSSSSSSSSLFLPASSRFTQSLSLSQSEMKSPPGMLHCTGMDKLEDLPPDLLRHAFAVADKDKSLGVPGCNQWLKCPVNLNGFDTHDLPMIWSYLPLKHRSRQCHQVTAKTCSYSIHVKHVFILKWPF